MKRVVLVVLAGLVLVLVVGGCKMEIEDDDSGRHSSAHRKGKQGQSAQGKKSSGSFRFHAGKGGASLSIVDGDDVVELHTGSSGTHIKIKSGEDSVTLKADKVGANIVVDDQNDSVKLRANAKGVRISVKSGPDSVTLNADDLHATIRLHQSGQTPPPRNPSPSRSRTYLLLCAAPPRHQAQ